MRSGTRDAEGVPAAGEGLGAAAEAGTSVVLHAGTAGSAAAQFPAEPPFSHEYSFIPRISSKGAGSITGSCLALFRVRLAKAVCGS